MTLFFWQWSYLEFKNHFSGLSEAQSEIKKLQTQFQRANVQTELVQYQFDLFKQQIAKTIPNVMKDLPPEAQSQSRGIASILKQPAQEFLIMAQIESSIDDLKKVFEKKQYQQVIRKGKHILDLHPVSDSLVSVYFMMAESYFQTNEFDQCLAMADFMTKLYPENEKTGYVLLRVGIFLKEKNRLEEAHNMFSLVSHAFAKEQTLKQQSEKLMASVGGIE